MKPSSKIFLGISGSTMIAAGIVVLCNYKATFDSIAWIIGVITLLSGIMTTALYFKERRLFFGSSALLFDGITDICLGILFINNTWLMSGILRYVMSLWLLFIGIGMLTHSLDMKHMGFKSWWGVLVAGIICAVLGIMSLLKPNIMALTVSILIGIGFIVHGIAYFAAIFGGRKIHGIFVKRKSQNNRDDYLDDYHEIYED